MKKVEFRAWDDKGKKMFKVEDVEWNNKCNKIIYVCGNGFEFLIKTIKLLQFIGLRDKKRKKIFEGDIVLIKTWLGLIKAKAVVEFDRGSFTANGESVSNWDDVEVLGNIYENKEVLK